LGCTLALSSILGREFCKYQENPNKELDFFNEVNPILEVSAPPMTQSLVLGTISGLVHMDPAYAYDTASSQIIENVCEALYTVNWSDPAYPTIPRLATAMPTITNGGLTYTIPLREGVTFHDGYAFNAATAKWTFDRYAYFINYSGNAYLPAPFNVPLPDTLLVTQTAILYTTADGRPLINETVINSEYSITLHLNEVKASFTVLLAFYGMSMLSYNSAPPLRYYLNHEVLVGTGPFEFVSYTALVEEKLKKFENYWRGASQIDTVTIAIIPSIPTLNQAFLSGNINVLLGPDKPFFAQIESAPGKELHFTGNTFNVAWVTFNYLHLDKAMRHAVSYALNYSYVIGVIYDGDAVRWPTYIPNGIPYANYSLDYAVFDRPVARNKLLTDSVWGPICTAAGLTASSTDAQWIAVANGGSGGPLAHYNYTWNIGNHYREDVGNRLAFDLEYIGVQLDVNGVTWGDFLDMIIADREKMDMYALGWAPDYLDPENYINPIWSNVSDINGGNFYEPDVQVLMDDALTETDPVVRGNMYWQIQKLMVEEYMPGMTLISGVNYDAWASNVHGWVSNPIDRAWFYPVYIDLTPPDITIHSPVSDQVFGVDAPTFSITIIDESPIDSTWYTIDGGVTNYTFYGLTGAINQNAWDSASQGNILIMFYAEDDTGKIGTSSVTVIKSIPSEPPIPGYDVFLIFGVISLVAIILMKKIKSK
jgi:peptide/nickel transport system substrate-binding protein